MSTRTSRLFRLICLFALMAMHGVLAAGEASSPPSISAAEARSIMEGKLSGCSNQQYCCSICDENTGNCTMVCTKDVGVPGKYLGECKQGMSVIGTSLRYRHIAHDYRAPTAPTASGCAPCGQAGGSPDSGILGLSLDRIHFQDTDIRSSLGVKTGFTWDIWVWCFPPGQVAGGHPTGQPGWQIYVSQPQAQPLDFLVLTDPTTSGLFKPEQGFENRGLVFYAVDGQGNRTVVTDPRNANLAILDQFGGGRLEFEMYTETDATQPRGRLTRHVDKNGNAVVATWKYAINDPTLTGSLRTKLTIRDRLTDAAGRSLVFTYDETRLYSGVYVCTRVDLPDGNHVGYRYNVQPNVWLGSEERLCGVDHPDGSVTTISSVADPTFPALVMTYDDPAADHGTSRHKTVHYSQGVWVNPANPSDQRSQAIGRAVRVADGAGDATFYGWFGGWWWPTNPPQTHTYTWTRGVLSLMVHDNGYKPKATYVWDGPAGTDYFDQNFAGWRMVFGHGYSGSTLPGSYTSAEGFQVIYERDPVSQRQTRATYQDGTVERWVRNALGDVTLHRDRLGRLTETVYDAAGNRLSVTRGWIAADPNNLATRTAPDGLSTERWAYWTAADTAIPWHGLPGQLRTHWDPVSTSTGDPNQNDVLHRTDYLYWPTGDLRSVVQPADVVGGPRAQDLRTYDAAGRLVAYRDAHYIDGVPTSGLLTTYGYDDAGRLVHTAYADGSYASTTYATSGVDAGLEIARRDRNGNVTTTTWDAAGRRLSESLSGPDAVVVGHTSWTWLPGTELLATQTRDGELTTYAYDGRMRRVGTTRHAAGSAALTETEVYADERRVATIDPYGRRTLFVYDTEERIVRTVRELIPGGVPVGADPAALVRISGANPAYVIEDVAYDDAGQVLARIDGTGVRSTMTYDALGRLATLTEAADVLPATTQYAYDAAGNRLTVTSPRGVVTATSYTGRNLLASVTEGVGSDVQAITRRVTYSLTGKPLTETDALDRVTTYAYGGCCDRLKKVYDPIPVGGQLGAYVSLDQDPVGNRTLVMDQLDHPVSTTYDARHRPLTVTNALGETTTYAYDEHLTDGAGIDAVAAVAAVLPSLGLGAGADGSAVAVTDPLTHTSYELRDGLGRTVARIDALGHATRVVYDTVAGELIETSQTDALGHVTRVRTDGAGRARQQVDALGNVSTAGFDAVGNQVAQRDALGLGWDAIYDARYRLLQRTSTRSDAVASTTWTYDLDGNRLTETDALAKTETSAYDARNRRTVLTDRLNGTTCFGYDLVGNLISISDADNEGASGGPQIANTTQYAYDLRNLLIAEAFPTGQQGRTLRVYGYDAARRLASRQVGILSGAFSATPSFAGASTTTTYGYDNANRLTTRGYPDGAADTFDYDAAGRLTDADSARYGTAVDRDYDAAGRLTSESLTVPDGSLVGATLTPATWTVGYTYLDDNSLATLTYPGGSLVTRTYTDRHELATVSLGSDRVVQRSYDASGRLATSVAGPAPGLSTETRTYVAGDHLVASIAVPGVTGFGYTYDATGRKLTETDSQSTGQTFGYDDAGRLTSWTAGVAATQSWNLTTVGDWVSTTRNGVTETRVNSAVHEATQVGANILSYDVQGNLTTDEHQTALAWDPENRLVRAIVPRNTSEGRYGSVATYQYDALGRRVGKTVQGLTTHYIHDGAHVIRAVDQPALAASAADIASDGTAANAALTPASGGIFPSSANLVRISFQPESSPIPPGYYADKGRTYGARTNGLSYGWAAGDLPAPTARGTAQAAELDTHAHLWQATQDAGLRGTYYDNMDFTGTMLTRLDSQVNFSWGTGVPITGIAADTFTARWLGLVEIPTTGTWTLTTNSDDGVRLWIDGSQVISNWTNHSPTLNSASRALTAGQHTVRMEYYENTGGAVAQLRWAGPGISQVAIPGTALTTARANTWEIALANGTYPVALICGDPLSLAQANHLLVEGAALTDLDPGYDWTVPGYQAGDFDGYLVSVTVTDGKLTIAAGMGAYDPKICCIEIGPAGTATEVQAMLTAATPVMTSLITEATTRTWEAAPVTDGVREFVYGSYIDEVVCYVVGQGAQAQRYYPHYNHLWSAAALTDSSGQVVERFTYDAYGRMTITGPGGVVRNKSVVGWDRGITGFILDLETGEYYARWRMYSPTLGRFISRDPMMYIDGLSLYRAYMIPNMVDPTGLAEADCKACDSCKGKKDIAPEIDARIKADLAAGGGADGVYQAEGRNAPRIGVIPMAAIEQWADRHNEATRPDPAKSKYRGTMLMNFLNNCVLVCGECIGSDKLGHMFQQGYEYRQLAKRWNEDVARRYGEWTEGVGSPADYPPPGSHAPRFGGYGRNASGVISFGDLAANDAGMQMYKDIEAGKFKTICDYVNGKMDEEKNPNQYDPTHPALGGINPGLPRP